MEFAMVFPLFFLILYGIVTFSVIFVAQQNLTLAAEEGARAAAACTAASNMVASLISTATCASSWATCTYDATMDCVNVTLTYNYASSPLVPNLPLTGLVLPASLVSSAMVQLNPENIL
jgi:Flp pilus assembly protein TadG